MRWCALLAPGALVATALTLVPAAASAATTLTVDQGSSSCTDTGAGTSAAPFCTITKAANTAKPGDTVQVAAGVYHEQVLAPSGVTFLAGSSNAVVDGTDDLGSAAWTAVTGTTTFSTVLASTSAPKQVLYNSTVLTTGSGMSFTPSTRTLTVDTGGTDPTGSNISAQWSYGFASNGTSGVVIDGFTLRRQLVAGVNLDTTSNATVKNVTATLAGSNGVNDNKGTSDTIDSVTATGNGSVGIRLANTTNSSVTSSTASNNGNHGISVQGGSGAVISNNVASGNLDPKQRRATGIDVSASATGPSTGTVVERNTTYANDDSGIEIYAGSTSAVVRRNVTYDNGDHGIDVEAPGVTIVSNTVVGNTTAGINLEAGVNGVTSSGGTVRDNIAVDNGLNKGVVPPRSKGNIRVDKDSLTNTTLDRDLVFQSDGTSALYEWNSLAYTDLAKFRTDSGEEAHGLVAEPKFVDLAGRDLHLTNGSPAVDAADSDAPGWTDADRSGAHPVDEPASDSGAGHVTYADLGAYELTDQPTPPADNAPTAALTATPSSIIEGGTVTLDASGSTDDHPGLTYVFGCGANGVTPTAQQGTAASCTYPTAGSYTAKVTVTDSSGQTAAATQAVTVNAAPPPPPTDNAPNAALTATPGTIDAGGTVTLDASGSTDDHSVTGYAFACDGPATGTAQTAKTSTCTYNTAGTYHPSVTVTDSAGQTATATQTVTVNAVPVPTAPLSLSASKVKQLVPVTLDASGSTAPGSSITSYQFTCDRQQPQPATSSPTATCTFRRMGAHSVQVVVTNAAGKTATATKTVTVLEGQPPTARLTLSKKYVRAGQRVKADASKSTGSKVSPIVAYRFQCGTRQRTKWGTKAATGCTFRHTGWHTITVWVKNSLGQVAEHSRLVHVSK